MLPLVCCTPLHFPVNMSTNESAQLAEPLWTDLGFIRERERERESEKEREKERERERE